MKLETTTDSPEATQAVAAQIASAIEPGDVIALCGDLGSGKTCFTQGLAAALGVGESGVVNSPTFVLLNVYQGRLPIYHFDTYRLGDPDTWLDLGAEEMLYGDGVCIIEWADLVAEALPEDRLSIEFEHVSMNERHLKLTSSGPNSERLVSRVTFGSQ
ncbi:MAG: tRNA (adenosine(37)-N6)-threonylcarbamoyltransferase complex ATPase subunit type 1 TsaE [Planctomycetota bacterium]|nr:tRNA (adenosine(37)-N6)-threonylcarbamoyltransferase complex ATPase subunit type 1 TsaE [Planctomycetota bacterium]MDA1140058.1 tRNA (adenosine(37)-N6)-threonylcarbamoyltransferase complex ATPase subunit type 1 TsaE [Planctomycetota bacterium]